MAGRKDVVTILLNSGTYIDPLDSEGRTPLMLAAEQGHCELVAVFVEAGADVNLMVSFF